jgi:hypothetical protein
MNASSHHLCIYRTGIPLLQAFFRVLLADTITPKQHRESPSQDTRPILLGTDPILGLLVAFLIRFSLQKPTVSDRILAPAALDFSPYGIEINHHFASSFQSAFCGSEIKLPSSWKGSHRKISSTWRTLRPSNSTT